MYQGFIKKKESFSSLEIVYAVKDCDPCDRAILLIRNYQLQHVVSRIQSPGLDVDITQKATLHVPYVFYLIFKMLVLLAMSLVVGLQFGAISFNMWYAESEFGAAPTVFGPMITVAAVTEIPMFFVAGDVVKRLGPVWCICLATGLSSARLLIYSLIG